MSQRYETLHEAMVDVLRSKPDLTATLRELVAGIAARDLWIRPSDNAYPPREQIRRRAVNYPHLFEVLPEARIRLLRK